MSSTLTESSSDVFTDDDGITTFSSSVNDDGEQQEPKVVNKKILGLDRFLCCSFLNVVLIIFLILVLSLLLLFVILFVVEKSKGPEFVEYKSNSYDTRASSLLERKLRDMNVYSFSQNDPSSGSIEGVLFLPNEGVSTIHEDGELTYGLFETSLFEEEPVHWVCQGTCKNERRAAAVLLPRLTFTLFSVATAAAVSFYMNAVRDGPDDGCGDAGESFKTAVECTVEDNEENTFFYFCSSRAYVEEEAVEHLKSLNDYNFLEDVQYATYQNCALDAKNYDMATAQAKAREYFRKAKNVVNMDIRSKQGINMDAIKDYKFVGCKTEVGIVELTSYPRCDSM